MVWGRREEETHTDTHTCSVLNGFLIPRESDHANPLFKHSASEEEDKKKKTARRTRSAHVPGGAEVN